MKISKLIPNVSIEIPNINSAARQHRLDILILVVLAVAAGFTSYQAAKLVNPILFNPNTFNVWFDADIPRVFANMTERLSDHYRVKVHPLFSLIAFSPVYVLRKALGIDAIAAVRLVIAAVASLWLGTMFVLLRLIGCRRFDATLFSLVAATSASAMFWFVVPETHLFGSLSMLVGLCLVAVTQYRKLSPWWFTGVSALTLSFTTTNWMVGILATLVNYSRKRALQITANAFCLVVLLWSVQKFIFPSAVFFLGDREEKQYLALHNSDMN